MRILKENSHPLKEETNPMAQKLNQLEEFLITNDIQIYSRNELFIKIDGKEFEVKDIDGGSGGGELPRSVSSEKLVLT